MENKTNKKVYLDDIAKELGVSKSTVSRAISGKGRIGEETRQRILELIKEYNYRPNVIAKSLAQSKTFNIGVLLPADKGLSEVPFFQGCLMGICEIASAYDYDVVVSTSTSSDISQLKRLIENRKVDGMILTRSVINDLAIEYLKREHIPFVLIGSCEDDEVIQIDTDHTSACCEMTSYLLSSGCKKLALLVGNESHVVNNARRDGYLLAFEKNNQSADETIIYHDMTSTGVIERAVADLLNKGCDSVVCGDDYICSKVLSSLEEKGIQIPIDIKVASFYNSAFLKSHNPAITAINIDVHELGMTAGRTIIDLIDAKEVSPKVLLGYELGIKKSSF